VGYDPSHPLQGIQEIKRVIKSGGRLALLYYSSQQLLPGYPFLEARLNATSAGIAPYSKRMKPEKHSLKLLYWFNQVGLYNPTVRTFTRDIQAPITDEIRHALIELLIMRWENAQSELSSEDWELYKRITNPESPEFILDSPYYYGFFTYTLFHGIVE
jgi:demethylmenaquinone methyltransferase/2-methoxy-6-polyprenyl-1,4-benzoquinol methylase